MERPLGITEQALLADIAEAIPLSGLRPGEITTADCADALGISKKAARGRLLRLVQRGMLDTRLALVDGRQTRVFWRRETERLDTEPTHIDHEEEESEYRRS